jgi:hypothetical protein
MNKYDQLPLFAMPDTSPEVQNYASMGQRTFFPDASSISGGHLMQSMSGETHNNFHSAAYGQNLGRSQY